MITSIRKKALALGSSVAVVAGLGVVAAPAANAEDYTVNPPAVTSCSLRAVQNGSKLRINIGPNLDGDAYYSFRIAYKTAKFGWLTQHEIRRTTGTSEVKTVNMPKGRYRVKCYNVDFPTITGTGFDMTSNVVRLKR